MQQHSSDATVMPGARFVDPTILARIGNLELLARTVVDGFINGLHRAPYFGASIDFAEHRGYVAGDDIRRVDWRLYARTDRYYIKQYEADTNANFCVILDISKSMSFGSKGITKLEYASYLAACLGYLAHKQRDRVGIITFDKEVVNYVPPSAKHFDVLLHTLDRAAATRRGDLSILKDMAQHFKRRTIIVLLSDFYEDPSAILEAVKPLHFLGNDLIAFQRLVRRVPVAEPVMRYALHLVRTSRPKAKDVPESVRKYVAFGASVRAAQFLVLGAKARAITNGRYHVSYDDVRAMAHPVLRHRVLTNFRAESEGITTDSIVDDLLTAVAMPKSGM
jgi:uncharacterized protein (DUF58 family)